MDNDTTDAGAPSERSPTEDLLARRLAFLAAAGETLASSLDYEQTLREVAGLALPMLGDMCIVDVLEDGELRRVASAHVVPAKTVLLDELRTRFGPSDGSPQPASRAHRSGRPELLKEVTPEVVAAHTHNPEHASLILRLGVRSHLSVPLVARGATVGVISLAVTESDRRYDDRDVAFAMDLARSAALAVDNARLYRAAQRDLARRRESEEALRVSEARFRAVFEQSPLSTQVFTPDGVTVRVNPAWEQLWGLSLASVANYNLLSDPQLEAQGIGALLRRAAGGEAVELPAIRYDPQESLPNASQNADPARWVRAFAYPIKESDGRVREVVIVHEDVTARVRAEERLREEDRRKDEFLATLAHELRNPLAPLRTGFDVLRRAPPGAPAERVRAVMERQVIHMVRLVDDLLDVSRVTRGKIELRVERIEVAALVSAALEVSGPMLEAAGLTLTVRLPSEPAAVEADRTRLAQVLSNLLNNAAKYTPRGGRVTLLVTREEGEVEIRLSDTGVGIPREMHERVFEMFVQVERSGRAEGGLGIGLTLVKRLVALHHGRVWVESEGVGRGSTFVVRLPLAREAQAQRVEAPDDAGRARAKRRVLVVDDNDDAAEMLSALLSLDGHEVRIASSGAEALSLLDAYRPEVAFLDIGMPGMSGLALAEAIRKRTELGAVVLVAVTGWGQPDDRRRSREAGFDLHLTKPVDVREVQAVLEALGA